MDQSSYRRAAFLFWGILGLVCVFFYAASMIDLPQGIHAWASADYYAMALKFAGVDFNPFHPRTFNLSVVDGITASDLPLPAWLSAGIMQLAGTVSPWAFRLPTLLAGAVGFYFFFRAMVAGNVSPYRAAILATLFWLLPGLCYYHNGFIPSTWALSAFLVALWAFQRYINGSEKHWTYMVAALTLAALLRKPYVFYLLALGMSQYQVIIQKRQKIAWLVGLSAFGLWQVYDTYLLHNHGTIFLRHFMYSESLWGTLESIVRVWGKWGYIWLSPAHLFWIASALALSLRGEAAERRAGRFLLGVVLVGIAYFLLMLRQFDDHDYYGIDAFYPAVLTAGWYLAGKTKKIRWMLYAECLLLVSALYFSYRTLQWYRNTPPNLVAEKTNQVYRDGERLLDSIGVAGNARVAVFEAYSANLPLIGLRRDGYALLSSSLRDQNKAFAFTPDYAVCLDTNFVSEVVNDNSMVVRSLAFAGRNRDFWVFKVGNYPSNQLENLLGSSAAMLADSTFISTDEFMLALSLPVAKGEKILFQGNAGMEQGGDIKATVALFRGGVLQYLRERPLDFAAGNPLRYCAADINVPDLEADEMRVYLWNPGRKKVSLERFKITRLQPFPPLW